MPTATDTPTPSAGAGDQRQRAAAPTLGRRLRELSGTGEPNSEIEIVVDDVAVGTTTSDGDGFWSFVTRLAEPGTYTVTARLLGGGGRGHHSRSRGDHDARAVGHRDRDRYTNAGTHGYRDARADGDKHRHAGADRYRYTGINRHGHACAQ
ncbi:MAG: hypothetical protein R2838_11425 [Caldilineaceae bacterium]